jgi:hypothetical protein
VKKKLSFVELAQHIISGNFITPAWQEACVKEVESYPVGFNYFADLNNSRIGMGERWHVILRSMKICWIAGERTELRTISFEPVKRPKAPIIIFDDPFLK